MEDREKLWALYFAGICSMQYHPRNAAQHKNDACAYAARIADQMLKEHERRFPCLGLSEEQRSRVTCSDQYSEATQQPQQTEPTSN